jgi:hypothetical protein
MCLGRKFADWEKELESKLAVSETISEKIKTDKKQLTKDIQKQVLQCENIICQQSVHVLVSEVGFWGEPSCCV